MKNVWMIILCFSVNYTMAQFNTNYWYFGKKAGVYFDSAGVHATTGSLVAAEGTASIADRCGLLFYTEGDTVWNKQHQMMVGGFGVGGKCEGFAVNSSTQSSLIVRQPSSDSIFYLFTTDCVEDSLQDGLRYSIINMNRQNGLGEVVLKNQPLLPLAEEKITAVKHANGCDIWIITHKFKSKDFYAYRLDAIGLDTVPVITTTGQIHNCQNPNYMHGRGYLKASPNGEKLINVNPDGAYFYCDTTFAELFSFNKQTGGVTSDFIFPLDSTNWWGSYNGWTIPFYGATFSPDNSKLYLSSGFYGPHLFQYDLSSGVAATILASKTFVATPFPYPAPLRNFPTAMVNAPDGKIYIGQKYREYLGVIQHPNLAGLSCNYIDSALQLQAGTESGWGGLPNFFEYYINPKVLASKFTCNLIVAQGDSVAFQNLSIGATNYSWHFGDGTYSSLINPVHVYTDTGYVDISLFAKDSACDVDRFCQTIYVTKSAVDALHEVETSTQFQISPNPFVNEFEIHTNRAANYKLQLFSSTGQLLREQLFQTSLRWQSSNLPKGVYYVKLYEGNQWVAVKRVLKN